MEVALPRSARDSRRIRHELGNSFERGTVRGIQNSKGQIIPINLHGKIVPIAQREWGLEEEVECVVADFEAVRVRRRDGSSRIGERRPCIK